MRNLIETNVNKAFKIIGDLKESVVLSSSNATGFNYTTGLPNVSTPSLHTLQAVVTFKKKKDSNSTIVELLIVSKQITAITNLDTFDKVTVRGIVYTIIPPWVDNGYTTTFIASSEVI